MKITNPKQNRAGCLFLVAMLFMAGSACANGIGLGAGPSDLVFKNLMKGGYGEETLFVSTKSESDLTVTVEKTGDVADWISITPKQLVLPAGGRRELTVIIRPPTDAANKVYTGIIYVKASPVGVVEQGSGSAIGARVAINVNAEISGIETVDYKILSGSVYDTEMGYPIEFQFRLQNLGNVRVTPEIFFNITGPKENPVRKTVTRNASSIMPASVSDSVLKLASSGMALGEYEAGISYIQKKTDPQTGKLVTSYTGFKTLKFNILPEGTISAKGYLDSLILDKTSAEVGEAVKINGVFKNLGEAVISAKLDCEVLEGTRLEAKIDGKESSTYPGQTKTLEAYYTPRKKGEYSITCLASYGSYQTSKKSLSLNVGGGAGANLLYLALLAVVAVVAVLAYKRGYLTSSRGEGGFKEV